MCKDMKGKLRRYFKFCALICVVFVLFTYHYGKLHTVNDTAEAQHVQLVYRQGSNTTMDYTSGILLVGGNTKRMTELIHTLNQYIIYHTDMYRKSNKTMHTANKKMVVANGNNVDFLELMAKATDILTLLLPWQLHVVEGGSDDTTYRCVMNEYSDTETINWKHKRCIFEKTPESEIVEALHIGTFYRCVYNGAMYKTAMPDNPLWQNPDTNGRMCLDDPNSMRTPTKLWPEYFKYHSTSDTYYDKPFDGVYRNFRRLPGEKECIMAQFSNSCPHCSHYPSAVTYVHLVYGHVRVNHDGYVENGHSKIQPIGCQFGPNSGFRNGNLSTQPLFVATQETLENYYHQFVEMTLKMVIYSDFLKARPDVKIHIPSNKTAFRNMIKLLGLKNPIHIGHWTGSLAILPMGQACHDAPLPALQYVQYYFQKNIPQPLPNSNPLIIYIHRNSNRGITNRNETVNVLQEYLKRYNSVVDLFIYNDSALPTFMETIGYFKRAKLIIAPHGAGLSNIVFASPKTFVIEISCTSPHARPTFRNISYKLGMRYIGMLTTHAATNMGPRCAKGVGMNIPDLKANLDVIFPIIKDEVE